jgi:hypothetical protein
MKRHFECDDPTQRIRQRRVPGGWHACVRDYHGIAAQFIMMRFQETREAVTSDFLLAFNHKRDIARQFSVGFQIGLNRFQMRQVLSFVIASATRENRMPRNPRLDGGCTS